MNASEAAVQLRVLSAPEDDFTFVALNGRLDLEGTGEIDLQFTSRTVAQRKPTVVDLAGVVFLASIGMRMLVTAAKSLGRYGHRCVLLNPRENVRDALEMAGLGKILLIASTENDAFRMARGQ
jgi:anti-sigma B factor antagonist